MPKILILRRVRIILQWLAKENNIPVTMVVDTNHIITSDYSEVVTVSQGADSVDLYLINRVNKGDIVITQDYGVAALALGKGAKAISNSGMIFDDTNIDKLLFERFLGKKVRNGPKSKRNMPHNRKRDKSDDEAFEISFRQMFQFD